MGNEAISIDARKPASTKVITIKQHSHLGPLTQIQHSGQKCNLKQFNIPDSFMMEELSKRLKTRIKKFSNNRHILNVYHIQRMEKKDLCVSNYQILAYIEKHSSSLASLIQQKLAKQKNFGQEEIYKFIVATVQSLIYIQDSGLRNIQLDSEAIVFCDPADKDKQTVKILDTTLSASNSYYRLLNNRDNQMPNSQIETSSLYFAPELLKDLKQLNYDPYLSPKADIFSLGMLVLQMICLQPMSCYFNYSSCQIDYESLIHRVSKISHSLAMKTLLAEMMEFDPQERIGFISLRQKVNSFLNKQTKSLTNRSKSSKMLKQLLVNSRKSSFSSQKTLNCNSSKNSVEKDRCSFSSSLQTFKESKQSSSQKQKLVTFANQKKDVNHSRRPSISLSSNYSQPFQLKNLVKNKMNKDKKQPETSMKPAEGTLCQTNNKQFNEGSCSRRSPVMVLERLDLNESNRDPEQNLKLMRSLQKDMKQFSDSCSQSKNPTDKDRITKNSCLNIRMLQQLKNESCEQSHRNSSEKRGKNTSRFGNEDSLCDANALKQQKQFTQRSNYIDPQVREFIKTNKPKIEPFKMFETNRRIEMQDIFPTKIVSEKASSQAEGFENRVLKKTMTFNAKEYLHDEKIVQKEENLRSKKEQSLYQNNQKLIFSPIQYSNSASNYESSEQRFHQTVGEASRTSQLSSFQPLGNFNQIQRKLHLNDFNSKFNQSIPDAGYQNDSESDSHAERYFPREFNHHFNSLKNKENSYGNVNNRSPFAKKGNGKKPNLHIELSQSPCYNLKGDKIAQSKYNSKNSKCLQYEDTAGRQTLMVSNQIRSKLEGMYQTSKSINSYSNFNSTSSAMNKQEQKSPQVDRLFINVASEGDQPFPAAKESRTDRFVFDNGQIYEGEFASDRTIEGNGTLYSPKDQIIYSGSWKNGKFNGYGTIFNQENSIQGKIDHRNLELRQNNWIKYEGEFENGQKNGFGTIYYANEQKFSGCLKKSVVDGYGCFYSSGGGLISGLWSKNVYTQF